MKMLATVLEIRLLFYICLSVLQETIKTRDSTDAARQRGKAASVLMPAKPVAAV